MVLRIFGNQNANNGISSRSSDMSVRCSDSDVSIFGSGPKTDVSDYSNLLPPFNYPKYKADKITQNALQRAQSQVGVMEQTNNNDGPQIAQYRIGESEDGNTPVDNRAPYCASFVSWCYENKAPFGYEKYTPTLKNKAVKAGFFTDKKQIGTGDGNTYNPEPGDLLMWINRSGKGGHVGMVESTEIIDGQLVIHTIEGNNKEDGDAETATTKATGNGQEGVVRRTYTLDEITSNNRIRGVIRMNDWIESEEAKRIGYPVNK